jgi:hypothetical protein
MTAKIQQQVVPRRRPALSYGLPSSRQRGSINSTTVSITLGIFVILAVTILSFLYLRQVQNTASQGSDIQALEERMVELRERQRSLELEGGELRSIRAIEKSVPELNLVAADHVSYLAQPGERVAARLGE